jgi:hypothetical protein
VYTEYAHIAEVLSQDMGARTIEDHLAAAHVPHEVTLYRTPSIAMMHGWSTCWMRGAVRSNRCFGGESTEVAFLRYSSGPVGVETPRTRRLQLLVRDVGAKAEAATATAIVHAQTAVAAPNDDPTLFLIAFCDLSANPEFAVRFPVVRIEGDASCQAEVKPVLHCVWARHGL